MSDKVWFITGASKGFGYVWTEAALARGDRVTAASRNIGTLDALAAKYGDKLLPIRLDVGDKSSVDAAVTQAALPIMRAQKSGHIIQISSIGGVFAIPTVGLYHASKWGLEGFSQALPAEVKELGIKVTIVEPGGFATDWGGPSAKRAGQLVAYDGARASLAHIRTASTPGDPAATSPVMLKLVDMAEPPLRIFFGDGGLPMIRREYAERLATWEKWNALSLEAQGHLAVH